MLLAPFIIAMNLSAVDPSHAAPTHFTNQRGAAVLFAPPEGMTEAYIQNRHMLLERLANEYPDQTFEAQVSVTQLLPVSELPELVDGMNITFLSLEHGGEHSGQLQFREGESLQEGLSRLQRYYDELLALLGESDTIRPSTVTRSEAPDQPLLIGARVIARPRDLIALRKQKGIRLVDPLWDELSDASGIEVVKIARPLDPEE